MAHGDVRRRPIAEATAEDRRGGFQSNEVRSQLNERKEECQENQALDGGRRPSTVVADDPADRQGRLQSIGGSQSDHWNNALANQTLQAVGNARGFSVKGFEGGAADAAQRSSMTVVAGSHAGTAIGSPRKSAGDAAVSVHEAGSEDQRAARCQPEPGRCPSRKTKGDAREHVPASPDASATCGRRPVGGDRKAVQSYLRRPSDHNAWSFSIRRAI
jgi:hypothetical protein